MIKIKPIIMSSKKIILCCVLTLIFSEVVNSQIDSINNISVIQRTDGSKILDIYYDLYGPEYYYNIEIQVSFNGGASFNKIDSLEGDWDVGVSPKTNRHAIWFAGKEQPTQYYDDALIKIISSTEYFTCGVSKMTHDGLEYGTAMHEGRCWLDRNLGASQVKTSDFDSLSFGDAYQWGRLSDGHEKLDSDTTSIRSITDMPGHNNFIVTPSQPYDWRSNPNNNLWQGVNGINNPCPVGFRLATKSEWEDGFTNIFQMISNLKLPYSGTRNRSSGNYDFDDDIFYAWPKYWTSTTDGGDVYAAEWYYYGEWVATNSRSQGYPVRCILDNNTLIEKPNYILPAHGSTQNTEFSDISWSHPNATVLFDVYFGANPNPPLVVYSNSNTLYDPGILEFNTDYYWRVVAKYSDGIAIASDLWSFNTRDFTCGSSIVYHEGITYETELLNDRCWLKSNLGTSQIAGSFNDVAAYGDYYQWGRLIDGHQSFISSTTTTISNTTIPGHDQFIISNTIPFDWINPQNDTLWQGENGTNNPCPENWHVPSSFEWELVSNGWNNRIDAFNSPLKLTSAGYRSGTDGEMLSRGIVGHYWTKSTNSNNTEYIYYDITSLNIQSSVRSYGYSVRCIKDEPIVLPSNLFPSNDSLLQTKYINLIWSCKDPDGDSLYYDIYFGDDIVPVLVESDYIDTIYNLNSLEYNKTYFWKIIAKDKFGTTRASDIWTFTVDKFNCGITTIKLNDSVYGTVDYAGYCWLDRNLGASKVASSTDDTLSYGSLYQWGRLTDGHEFPYSDILYYNLSNTPVPGHDDFIVCQEEIPFYDDWMEPPDPNRWQGLSGLNNPCPNDWLVPNNIIWQEAIDSLSNPSDPFDCPLKLPFGGYRPGIDGAPAGGQISERGVFGSFWSSTSESPFTFLIDFASQGSPGWNYNSNGFSVRCIKNWIKPDPPSNPTPVDGATNIPVNTTLSWTCIHPEDDELVYNIYLGDNINPPRIITNHPDVSYSPDPLNYNTTYYWRIEAVDEEGNPTLGTTWQFHTEELDCGSSSFIFDGLTYGTVDHAGLCWLDRNMGAERIAISHDDSLAYGDYYQRGRLTDGHQLKNSETTSLVSPSYIPGHNKFIVNSSDPYDWQTPQNDLLWQGNDALNNPCPAGWKVPTEIDWQNASASWGNGYDAFNSALKLTGHGSRRNYDGSLNDYYGCYWSSTISGIRAKALRFDYNSYLQLYSYARTQGMRVRCIKN